MKHGTFIETTFDIKDDVFFTNYWEERPFYYHNKNSNNLSNNFFTANDLEELLYNRTLTNHQLRLSSTNSNIPIQAYSEPDGRVIPDKLFYYFSLGNTIVIKNLEFFFSKVKAKLDSFQNGGPLLKRSFVNLYLTPSASQGFVTHYDTQEVFVIQILGKKKWSLFEPSNSLPVEDHKVNIENTGNLINEITLEVGDALYIPRGIYHHALAAGELSCHLTFSFVPMTYGDVLLEVLNKSITTNPQLRKSLLIDLPSGDFVFSQQSIKKTYEDLITNLNSKTEYGFNRFFQMKFPQITDETKVKRSEFDFKIDRKGNHVIISINDLSYRFPVEVESILQTLYELDSDILVKDISRNIDDESLLLILTKLKEFRFIEVA